MAVIPFKCSIEDKTERFLPKFYSNKNIQETNFVINPKILIQYDDELPTKFLEKIGIHSAISKKYPIVWVEEPHTNMIFPYWLQTKYWEEFENLFEKKIKIKDLSEKTKEYFIYSSIIIPENTLTTEYKNNLFTYYNKLATELAVNEYIILKNILNPINLSAYRYHIRNLELKEMFAETDIQVENRKNIKNEPLMRYFHLQVSKLVNFLTGEKIIPSYSFLAIYPKGSELKKHIDRDQCKWNISLALDMCPEEVEPEKAWSIYIESNKKNTDKENIIEIKLGIGDAVLYRGNQLQHWRNKLTEHDKFYACFFHFVDYKFEDSLI